MLTSCAASFTCFDLVSSPTGTIIVPFIVQANNQSLNSLLFQPEKVILFYSDSTITAAWMKKLPHLLRTRFKQDS